MEALLSRVERYYSERLMQHGDTPHGVDWNGEASQIARFRQLAKVIDPSRKSYSINDLGCGYGALYDFLREEGRSVDYRGYDLSADMVAAAIGRHGLQFEQASAPSRIADYGVASGIFNVMAGASAEEWQQYVFDTLDVLNSTSAEGFAFNCLTSYSDADKTQPGLHYANPLELFDRCKRLYSRQVGLLHDYGLWEFTILVRKT
jgi:SAM-dependent methyltransferase